MLVARVGYDPDQPRDQQYSIEIQGPFGRVRAERMVWATDRADYVEELYRAILNHLDGVYNCCLDGRSFYL